MSQLRLTAVRIFISFSLLGAGTATAGDWPTFRGPQRNAISPETGLLQEWPSDGPKLLWQTEGAGRGYSSLAIAGGRIYTLGDGPSTADDKDEYLLCFEQADGKPVWRAKTGAAFHHRNADWGSSRSTPTVDGALVYVLTPTSDLVCCQTADGKERWRKNLKADFGGNKADGWGYSESVLVDGDLVVCTPGGQKATLVALNKHTGEPVWTAVREGDRGAGHASIVVSEIAGTRVYVQCTGSGPLGVRASDGKVLWSFPIRQITAVIPTPIVRGDLVFFTAAYGLGGGLLRQVPAADGEVKIEEVYPINIELANKHGGVVLVGDFLYGDSDDKGVLFCAELLTGKNRWKHRGAGKGSASVAEADGRLYVHFADGTMSLVEASPDEYRELGSFKVPGSGERPGWSHPVISDGKLYVREQDTLCCYDVRSH